MKKEKIIKKHKAPLKSYRKKTEVLKKNYLNAKKRIDELEKEKQWVEKITSISPSVITVFDLNKRYDIFENKSLLSTLGYKGKEFYRIENLPHKDRLKAIIHPEDLPSMKRFYADARKMKNGSTHEMEFRIKDSGGNWKWFRRLASVFKKNPGGKVEQIISIFDNINERKKSEIELLQTKRLLERITATSPAIIAVADLNKGTNIYQNRSILEMLGYSKNKIKEFTSKPGSIYSKLIHPDDVKRIRYFDKLVNSLEDNKSYDIEYRLKDSSGKWQWIRRVCRIFERDQKGFPSHMVSIFENINKNKESEEQLKESEHTAQALLNTITETVFMMDTKGKVLTMNDTAAQRLGRTKDAITGKYIFDFFPKSVRAKRKQNLTETVKQKKPIRVIDERNGKYFDTIGYPVFNKLNEIDKVIVFSKDITEQVQYERIIRESEERYRNLIESSPDAIVVHLNGKVIFANNSSAVMLGYGNPDEILNENVFDIIHPDYSKAVASRITKVVQKGEKVPFIEEKFRKKDGTYLDVEVSAQPFHFKGKTAVQIIARDISGRKEAEKALRESEERYKTLYESANDAIFLMKNDKFTDCNLSVTKMFGFDKEYIIGKTPFDFSPEYQPDGMKSEEKGNMLLEKVIKGGIQFFEWQHKNSNNELFDAEVSLNPIKLGKDTFILAIVRNITERKQAENQLRKLTRAVEQSPVSIIITDTDGSIEYVNPKFTEITQYSFDEVKGKNPRILKSGNKSPEEYNELWDKIISGKEWIGEFHNKKKNGELFWESALITPIKNDKGAISHYLAIKQDITEQKIVDEKLKQSLKEKEVMLREIHHRVKNNLQIISSLLKLQSGYTKDSAATEYLNISQQRVKTMALIHQQLYRSENLTRIDFDEYLKQLGNNLFIAYGRDDKEISMEISAKNLFLSIDQAIPCGLIINELISNSFKHAFPNISKGTIKIEISKNSSEYVLRVGDDGIGLPANVDFRNTQSLGMQLVITLVEQLEGSVELSNNNGTDFVIKFAETE